MDGRVRYLVLFLLFAATAQAAPLSPADRDAVRQQQEQLLLQNQQQRDELERSTRCRAQTRACLPLSPAAPVLPFTPSPFPASPLSAQRRSRN